MAIRFKLKTNIKVNRQSSFNHSEVYDFNLNTWSRQMFPEKDHKSSWVAKDIGQMTSDSIQV